MATSVRIKGTPQPEPITGTLFSLLAPGHGGLVEQLDPGVGGRAVGDPLPLESAASGTDTLVLGRLALTLTPPPPGAATGGRAMGGAQPQLLVPKNPDLEYVVLHTDENGASRWVFPQVVGDTAVFEIPADDRATGKAPDGGRGEVTKGMRVIVRVLAWVAKPILGAGALAVASAWERAKRKYGWWQLNPKGEFGEPDWAFFNSGPTLLLVHGTFSTPQAGFAGWVGTEACEKVLARYGNRCLAIAHPSLSASPDDNFEWLSRELAANLQGPVDVVCHSRGGLLARVLAAHNQLSVRRICQVGVPNVGTPLAHAEHWFAFLDGHTRWLTALPDTVSTVIMEGILCVMKLIATGAGAGLPGIAAMDPAGEYLAGLGKRALHSREWFTVSADFKPDRAADPLMVKRLADKVVDRFFEEANDMVVPTEGCHLPGPAVKDSLRLQGGAVHHCNYFVDLGVHEKLDSWLA
jgi:pimeloyl-ACP methyl ester carboxylesterase